VSASTRGANTTRVLVTLSEGLIVRIFGATFPSLLAAIAATIVSCVASSIVFTNTSAIVRLALALSGFLVDRRSTFNATIIVAKLLATNPSTINASRVVAIAVGESSMLGCMA